MTNTELKSRWLKARNAIIEHDYSGLNAEQLSAVKTTEGALLLLAGAGSGKTTVIINRIANLIKYGCASDSDEIPQDASEEKLALMEKYLDGFSDEYKAEAEAIAAFHPVEPWRIIAITFTNKAAQELKERLQKKLGEKAGDIWASTFHSACLRILHREIEQLGIFSSNFTIYDTNDSLSLIKHIMKELDYDEKKFPARSIISRISASKDEMISAEEFAAKAGPDPWKRMVGEIYLEYTKRMREANALDFDDLILYTVKLFMECEDVREHYQNYFKYVLVDEYQDTNMLQYKLVSLLSGKRRNICVVGDDDQGIYKFRGATIENILSFEKQYADCRVIRLEQNYRSTEYILNASNSVIKCNSERKGKQLWTNNGRGEKLTLYLAANENDEAQYIASQILNAVAQGGSWNDFAVLYRMNAQSNQLEHAFKRNGIPYKVFGGMKFYDRAEIKDMLAYLCVINNPDDDLRLTRIINVPPRGIGDKTISTALEIAARNGTSLFEVIKNARNIDELGRSAPKLVIFANMIDEIRDELPSLTLEELYDMLLAKTGYLSALEEKNTQEDITRAENVRELKTNIIAFVKERGGLGNLTEFLDEMALYTDMDDAEKDASYATLMTMHSAKGLEFPTVFIVGAEENIFPGTRAIGDPAEIEEERRLCYVAMTRAKKKLYISAAKQRMLFGKTSCNSLSRFVKEIPEDCLDTVQAMRSVSTYYSGEGNYSQGRQEYSGLRTRTMYNSQYSRRAEPQEAKPEHPITPPKPAAKAAPVPDFKKGDAVVHKAFGKGFISTMQEMGGDFLVEIIFDKVGTKRLMLKSAAQYMKKA